MTLIIAGVAMLSGMPTVPENTSTQSGVKTDPVTSVTGGVQPSRVAAAPAAGSSPILRATAIQGRCRRDTHQVHDAAAAIDSSDTSVASVRRGASSAGDADIHGYATYPDRALHVIYLGALWDRQARARIPAADEWRATVTLRPADDIFPADVAVHYWYTDLPGGCFEVTSSGGAEGTTTFTVVVRDVARLRSNRSYTTEVHFASAHDLAGTPWTYHEQLLTTRHGRSRSARTPYRWGEIGTCPSCFVTWDITRPPRAHATATSP